jgi:hypothetical protein
VIYLFLGFMGTRDICGTGKYNRANYSSMKKKREKKDRAAPNGSRLF